MTSLYCLTIKSSSNCKFKYFRSTIARLNPDSDTEVPAYMLSTASSKIKQGGTLERKKNMGAASMVNLAKENPGVSKGFTAVTSKLGNG